MFQSNTFVSLLVGGCALVFALQGCGGGGSGNADEKASPTASPGDASAPTPTPTPTPTPAPAPAPKLYVGYYVEDAVNNPEDPTIGSLMVKAPSNDGPFAGLMPFSYLGCIAGADIGGVSGTRSGVSFDGAWTGTVDNVPVGGTYQGTYAPSSDTFSGNYTNAGGKVPFGTGGCSGFVAANGTWKIFGTTASEPPTFVATATAGNTPTISWPSAGAAIRYDVRVFDEDCLNVNPSNAACFNGEAFTNGTNIQFPAQFQSALPLNGGGHYLVLVTGQDLTTGALLSFSSLRVLP